MEKRKRRRGTAPATLTASQVALFVDLRRPTGGKIDPADDGPSETSAPCEITPAQYAAECDVWVERIEALAHRYLFNEEIERVMIATRRRDDDAKALMRVHARVYAEVLRRMH